MLLPGFITQCRVRIQTLTEEKAKEEKEEDCLGNV